MVLEGKSSQEYPVNAGVIYADDTTLYSKCDRASDLWEQLELASELVSDLRDTVDWGRKWFVDFNAGKTQLFRLYQRCETLFRHCFNVGH